MEVARANPLGRGTGLDYVYNPQQVIGALQSGLMMGQRQAQMDAINAFRQAQLDRRAEQAALKQATITPDSGGYWDDVLAEDRNRLTQTLTQSMKDGTYNATQAAADMSNHKQEAAVFRNATKQVDAQLNEYSKKYPFFDPNTSKKVFHRNRITDAQEQLKQRQGFDIFVPNTQKVVESTIDDPESYTSPVLVGKYVVDKLSGTDSYTFAGPKGTGKTATREKIFTPDGKLDFEVAKDVVMSDEGVKRAYNAFYGPSLAAKEAQLGRRATPQEQAIVADNVLNTMFPEMLGNRTVKIDDTPMKLPQGKASQSPLKNIVVQQTETSDRVMLQQTDASQPKGYRRDDTMYEQDVRPTTTLFEAKKNAMPSFTMPVNSRALFIGNPEENGVLKTGYTLLKKDAVVSEPALTAIPYANENITLSNGTYLRGGQQVPKSLLGDPALKGKWNTIVGFQVVPLEAQEGGGLTVTQEVDNKGKPVGPAKETRSDPNKLQAGVSRINTMGKMFIPLEDAPSGLKALFKEKLGPKGYEREVQRYRNLYGGKSTKEITSLQDLGFK